VMTLPTQWCRAQSGAISSVGECCSACQPFGWHGTRLQAYFFGCLRWQLARGPIRVAHGLDLRLLECGQGDRLVSLLPTVRGLAGWDVCRCLVPRVEKQHLSAMVASCSSGTRGRGCRHLSCEKSDELFPLGIVARCCARFSNQLLT